jgi:hypothetical protein
MESNNQENPSGLANKNIELFHPKAKTGLKQYQSAYMP